MWKLNSAKMLETDETCFWSTSLHIIKNVSRTEARNCFSCSTKQSKTIRNLCMCWGVISEEMNFKAFDEIGSWVFLIQWQHCAKNIILVGFDIHVWNPIKSYFRHLLGKNWRSTTTRSAGSWNFRAFIGIIGATCVILGGKVGGNS